MAEEQGNPEERPKKLERAINFWKKHNFVHNTVQIIRKAAELNFESDGIYNDLMDKMIHSIFFLGNINGACSFYPHEIFDDYDIFRVILEHFWRPIEKSTTKVPVRTPFSYFLELVVKISENEEQVRNVLTETLKDCRKTNRKYPLISSVICICRVYGRCYYGGSLSCPGDLAREIMTAVSCYHVWDNYVSSAVLSVFPKDKPNPLTMTLPWSVQCRAYAIDNLSEVKAPCLRCHELYSLPNHSAWWYYPGNSAETEAITHSNHRNEPGNCAETEAISNLLKKENQVRNKTTINRRVLEEECIKEIMTDYFNKIKKGKIENRGNYSIDKIYISKI